MELFPAGERPVMEEKETLSAVSPDSIKRLRSLLREVYKQRSAWRGYVSSQSPPRLNVVRSMLLEMKGVEPLQGAKVLYLDDTSQYRLSFLTCLTLATRRRVERIFYHGETVRKLVEKVRERIKRCPQPHLFIVDEYLEMLPSLKYAGHTEHGHEVIGYLHGSLRSAGIPSVGVYANPDLRTIFLQAGADGVVSKYLPAEAAVEQTATIFHDTLEHFRQQQDREERFMISD